MIDTFLGARFLTKLYLYYCYYLFRHSVCWCSVCASAGRKPWTWSISHLRQSFCSYTKYLPEDSCRPQHADILGHCHTSVLSYFLYVFYHILLYCVKRTNHHRDHFGFHLPYSLFLVLGLCSCFSFRFPSLRCFHLME